MKKVSSGNVAALLTSMTSALAVAPLYGATQGTPTSAEPSGLACAACAGIFMVIPLIYLVISLIVGVWMYRDAQRRSDSQAVLWLILGVVFNIAALLIYLAVRKSRQVPPPFE